MNLSNTPQESRKAQAQTIAFLGPTASYSHQATIIAFPDRSAQSRYIPISSIRDVFDAVQDGRATRGVVPFENSTHGTVSFTLDALADRKDELRDVVVCGEVYLPVVHCLLGKPATSQAASLEAKGAEGSDGTDPAFAHIRRVYSHPQGFGQTGAFLKSRLRHAEQIDVSSTSKGAEMAAGDKSGASAAIASELAAEAYKENGLGVLVKGVQDRDDNVTRFFIIRKGTSSADDDQDAEGRGKGSGRKWKSLVSFTVPHDRPGALADVLECFRKGGLNLTSINSLPSLVRPFQYLFFVEFEGRRWSGRDGGDGDGVVERVLREVEKAAQTWRWLGCWEDQRS